MKKRIVAVLLSLTLSSAMLAEVGAAAVTEVSAAELFTSGVSGEAGAVIGTEETGDTMPVTEPAAETGTDDTTFDDETDITIEVPVDGESGGTEDPSDQQRRLVRLRRQRILPRIRRRMQKWNSQTICLYQKQFRRRMRFRIRTPRSVWRKQKIRQ